MLGTDRDTDQVFGNARVDLLLVCQLLVRGRPGVNRQSLGVADVGQVRNKLEAVDDLASRVGATLDADAEHAAEPALEVLLGVFVGTVALEAGVRHPADVGAVLEVAGEREGVLRVALAAEGKCLETDEKLLRSERVEARAQVAQDLNAHPDDVGDGTEGLPELEPVVALGRLDHLREAVGVLAPVELAAVDDDAADGGAVAADPLGRGVDDDVGAVVDGAHEVAAGTEGVVDLGERELVIGRFGQARQRETYDNRNTLLVGKLGDGLKVGNVIAGVANALDVDSLSLLVDGSGQVLGLVASDELGLDAVAGKHDLELVVGSAVEVGGRDNVVTGVGEGGDGHELSGLAGGSGDGGNTALEGSHALLEDINGRASYTGVRAFVFCYKSFLLALLTS